MNSALTSEQFQRKPSNAAPRLGFISFANVIATLSVLYLHVNGGFWTAGVTHPMWPSANIIESLFYFAVPLFMMISGATLMDFFDRYGLRKYFLRRAQKTLIPYLYFSILAISIQIWRGKLKIEQLDYRYIISSLINGGFGPNYWFFPLIFCVYLSIPLFAAIRKDLRSKVFIYLAVAGFLLNIFYPFMNNVHHWGYPTSISVNLLNGYLIYLPMGYLIAHKDFKWWIRVLIYAVGIGGLLIHILKTYDLSVAASKVDSTFKGYLNAPCIVYSVSVFLGLRYLGQRLMEIRWFAKTIYFATTTTLTIYLIHQYLLDYFAQSVFQVDVMSLPYRLFMPWFLFLLICIPIHFLQKIDGLKIILPE